MAGDDKAKKLVQDVGKGLLAKGQARLVSVGGALPLPPPPKCETWEVDPTRAGWQVCRGCKAELSPGAPDGDFHRCPPPVVAPSSADAAERARGAVSRLLNLVHTKNSERSMGNMEEPFQRRPGEIPPKERLRRLKILAHLAPRGFECKASCGKCCKVPLDVTHVEWQDLKSRGVAADVLNEHEEAKRTVFVLPATDYGVKVGMESQACPFLDGDTMRCRIYEERPFSCRSYGQHWMQLCREGVVAKPGPKREGGQVIPDRDMHKWAELHGHPTGLIDLERWNHLHELTDRWRNEVPENERYDRLDRIPDFDDLKRLMAEDATRAKVDPTPTDVKE